ncbi:hypothetical protein ACR78F_09540 [Sphingobacterium spiritivorum]|uniref:Uncharacterized protein n=2 Tax=Sphingobacterium spiritivorum TaxID=258 RepID=D7VP59_SPHSI|nr:hypothetical protein [Sphingobacterium spiritivorum]EEI92196.1 hypothetical protein HMPREF0765_2186 [Sphingobacterium spiritivorum ATCC 33300]EFK57706.1 hypothetical protein HMPREF0766_12779 [Sphingobacterium spiritivorum ATCC 33861]QQS96700.1 hypothetical protein I6J03_03025 [Sphingobacterium spiritivorum]QQT36258.1 hypothetical protein I6J01_02175 [Sphingobacterium spiritivorum]WQD32996.1 hypothetical protein U0038_15870 [Sphingobacterium spiritivorum]
MKRILLALLVIGTTIGLSSCTKEYITNSLPGVSYVLAVKQGDWQLQSGTDRYKTTISMPQLDSRYFEDGDVSVAISYDNDKTAYKLIPAVIRNYSYEASYRVGSVEIEATEVGTNPTIVPPGDMLVKIVLTDAEIGN